MTNRRTMTRSFGVIFCLLLISWLSIAGGADRVFTPEERSHWAFQPVRRSDVPQVRQSALVHNPIDAFLLARLEPEGLSFSKPATRGDLIRRVTFDLTGLPPTPEEIAAFQADTADDAYERLIDRLLASPHYGEHWGRYWLDVVRYAETAGYNADPLRPLAWKYRDYVITALNNDVPYDRFVQEQLAGDELFPDNAQAVLATGYTLLWPDESNASNILLARQDALNDLTSNVGSVFLGMSIGCAQCHDHKFDALPQKDFYRLQAFFSGIVRCDNSPVGKPDQLAAYTEQLAQWREQTAGLRDELHRLEYQARVKASGDRRMKFPAVVLEAIDTAPENRTTYQRQLAYWSERQMDIKEEVVTSNLTDEQKKRRAELTKELAEWDRKKPKPPAEVAGMIVGELQTVPPPTHRLTGGSYDKPAEEVTPGFLSVLCGEAESIPEVAPPNSHTSGRRSALARWLTDPSNRLTPRVIVNRIWQGHFGKGLVNNANDFGTQTGPPSHPELLDWLASEFIAPTVRNAKSEAGIPWSLKTLHRLILTSNAYRQATDRSGPLLEPTLGAQIDPGNRLYWHFDRHRLNAESIRDAFLAVSGRLDKTLNGPSVFPELPADFSKREAWSTSKNPMDRVRRSVYIHSKRNLPYPLLEAFDLPDMHESCACRTQTTVAPQALMLLNSDLVVEYAQSFAGRLLVDNPNGEIGPLVQKAYLLAFGREPREEEIAAAGRFIGRQQSLLELERAPGRPLSLPRNFPKFLDPPLAAAITDFCHVLMNASEFVYVD